MLASAREALPKAARAISTSAALQAAVPAVATSKRSFLAQLFGSGSRVEVPLTDALPGVTIPEPVAAPLEAPTTQLTKLSNGFTVATENTPVRGLLGPGRLCELHERPKGRRWGPRRSRSQGLTAAAPACLAGRHRHLGHLCGQRQRV